MFLPGAWSRAQAVSYGGQNWEMWEEGGLYGVCAGEAFCVSLQRLTGGCPVKPGTELCF